MKPNCSGPVIFNIKVQRKREQKGFVGNICTSVPRGKNTQTGIDAVSQKKPREGSVVTEQVFCYIKNAILLGTKKQAQKLPQNQDKRE